ncbi:MAG: hypothetical protein JWM96_1274 [Alphaproteobacteria bacterium]|nr:hypothetical protein [Alphaproteobacteria bacterium]
MTPLQQRALTAAILAPLFLFAVYLGDVIFAVMIVAISLIGFAEWLGLARTGGEKILGLFYLGLPAFCLIWLRQQGLAPILMVILAVWLTDTGAYFAGRHFGGPKLAPKISPNKTWSGLIGGMVAAALVTGLVALAFRLEIWGVYFGVGAMLAVIAQIGDLFESHMKRRAGVKDSGKIMPGHGGVLDRIDGLLSAAPCFALFVWLMA